MADNNLTTEEVEVFAHGLYYIASRDGIDESEEKLIREFLDESGAEVTWEDIARPDFDPIEAANLLQATFLRRIFLSAAVALVKADGQYTDEERVALGEIADAFGISNAEFGAIEQLAAKVNITDA